MCRLVCIAVLGFLAGSLQGCNSGERENVIILSGACGGFNQDECEDNDDKCIWAVANGCGVINPWCPSVKCFEEFDDCLPFVAGAVNMSDSIASNEADSLREERLQNCCLRTSRCFHVIAPDGSGGVAGGSTGASSASFAAGTLVQAADGSWRRVEDIRLGDHLAMGGLVTGRMEFFAQKEELFVYRRPGATDAKGIIVAASHAVLEGGVWRRVRDAPGAAPIDESLWRSILVQGETRARLYDFDVENHRLVVQGALAPNDEAMEAGVVFADFSEVDIENLAVQRFEDSLLALLQAEQDAKMEV